MNHLLVHCSKARLLWDLMLTLVGVKWAFPLTATEILISWHGSFVGMNRK